MLWGLFDGLSGVGLDCPKARGGSCSLKSSKEGIPATPSAPKKKSHSVGGEGGDSATASAITIMWGIMLPSEMGELIFTISKI